MRLTIALILSLGLAACGPGTETAPAEPPAETAAPPAPSGVVRDVTERDPIHAPVIAAANTTLGEQVGMPVSIQPEIFRTEGGWAFVSGPVRAEDGSEIDWSETNMAEAARDGMMDGDVAVVLLNRLTGDWAVAEAAIGPTDVPQVGWPDEHHVSPALVGQEGA